MFELIALFGAQMVLSLLGSYGADAPWADAAESETSEAEEPETYSDENEAVVSEEYGSGLDAYLNARIDAGHVSAEDAETARATAEYPSGALNVDMAGGDDTLIGSSGQDTLGAGAGDDLVEGGAGDDHVAMGAGSDSYGLTGYARLAGEETNCPEPGEGAHSGSENSLEAGDDTIWGGSGDDMIADGYGSNHIYGSTGHDFIVTVDQDDGAADVVSGGWGRDEIIVDEGDTVSTGEMGDWVAVDIWNMVEEGYDPVTITDFNRDEDQLVLLGEYAALFGPQPADPTLEPEMRISVEDLESEAGAVVFVSGVPVIVVLGGQGMNASEIELRPY